MSKYTAIIGWEDVPHLSDREKLELAQSFHPSQRRARTEGIPQLGAGAIYPVAVDEIRVDPFEIPAYWKRAYALDVGWNRTAALWGAIDPDTDILYCVSEYYRAEAEPPIHAEAIKSRGFWIPGTVDPAARGRGQRDGERLLQIYTDLGLAIIPADNSVESGIYAVWIRFSTGRLKIFSTLQHFFHEYRLYRRDEKGRIVKNNDHLMDCARYLVMTGISIARPFPTRDDTPAWRRRLKAHALGVGSAQSA